MKRTKVDKYMVTGIGPGPATGPKFTSATEALRFAAYLLKNGESAQIIHI